MILFLTKVRFILTFVRRHMLFELITIEYGAKIDLQVVQKTNLYLSIPTSNNVEMVGQVTHLYVFNRLKLVQFVKNLRQNNGRGKIWWLLLPCNSCGVCYEVFQIC